MKKINTSSLLVLGAGAWIMTGMMALVVYRNDYMPAIRFAGVGLLLDSLLLLGVSYSCTATLKEKKWIIAEAAVDGLFSILLLLDPVFTLFVFPFIVTPWIVTKGFVTMAAALALKKSVHGWSGDLAGGFFLVCCGLLISHSPLEYPFGINIITGAIGWTIGVLYLYDAYRFRKINGSFHGGLSNNR